MIPSPVAGLAAIALLLAACSPSPGCPWPGFRCAIGGPPMTADLSPARPPVVVDNPFACRRASP